jgi:hypothetical protein
MALGMSDVHPASSTEASGKSAERECDRRGAQRAAKMMDPFPVKLGYHIWKTMFFLL